MAKKTNGVPNPKRVAAGRRNRLKRRGLSDAGRQRLRDAARANKPWLHSTGPRTAAGKAQAALNGKLRQLDAMSVREVRGEFSGLNNVIEQLAALRRQIRDNVG
jgi:hypothetical protein